MKPVAFAYCRPGSIAEACVELSRDFDARVLARGQTLIVLLAKALTFVGHLATRHRGTVGGSIANGDPAAEIPLVAIALEARIALKSASHAQEMAASDFYLGPMLTALRAGAMVTEVHFPIWRQGRVGAAFHEVSARAGDFALVACSAPPNSGRVSTPCAPVGGPVAEPVGERRTL
jgi:CO/xanthine dehydrogenase FAD-binding subunit